MTNQGRTEDVGVRWRYAETAAKWRLLRDATAGKKRGRITPRDVLRRSGFVPAASAQMKEIPRFARNDGKKL